ncbi:hypothetical protein MRX96_003340 [Rhipicephalus microplus]
MTDSNTSSQVGAPSPAVPPSEAQFRRCRRTVSYLSRRTGGRRLECRIAGLHGLPLEIPWECLALVVIVAVGLCVGLSVAVHALWTRYSDHGSRVAAEARLSSSGDFRSYAAATDAVQCAPVTRFIFERNGSVADAAIATFLCACVVLPHAVGIGGGFIALIYDRKENATHVLDAREVAPLGSQAGHVHSEHGGGSRRWPCGGCSWRGSRPGRTAPALRPITVGRAFHARGEPRAIRLSRGSRARRGPGRRPDHV